jgi:exosome complex component RRP42
MSAPGIEIAPEINFERLEKYLSEGKRFDGRTPGEFRELIIEKDVSKKAEGSVRVKLGDTEVIVGVKAGIGTPYPDSQDKGNLMVTAEMSPLSSPRVELGPPKFPAIELGRVIDRGIRESHVIDLKQLCITEGEKVWTIFIDIYAINDDGNLLDAAGIGALAALKVSKLPKYDEKEEKVLYGENDKDMPLTKVNPIAITVHRIGNSLIVDPNREEEDLSEGRLTIGISEGRISSMQKGNAGTFTIEEVEKAVEMADKSWKELFKNLEKQLK